ncbi:MAG: helix-turn-helix domain-containing protein [Actinomycetota bacterium]
MRNERLRAAILSSGLGVQGAAERIGVDPKTVERWIAGRLPYTKHQYALASALGVDLPHLWPDARPTEEVSAMGQAEVAAVYPHRSVVPTDLWMRLFAGAEQNLDVLVFSGFWLSEDRQFHELVEAKAAAGTAIRILLGDPESQEVARRGEDEGIGEVMAGKVRNALLNYGPLTAREGTEFRLHSTVLYNSIYRADDEMLVNTHVYGVGAYLAPVLHLRRVPGASLFSAYLDSFERVWAGARLVEPALADRGRS